MSEIVTREIIGLAQKSKWQKILEVTKTLVKKTLKNRAGYTVVALDAIINNKKREEFSDLIQSVDDLNKLDGISSFSMLSLYQFTDTSSDHINISHQDGIIILIAKYMGPAIEHHEYFDFMVHMDPLQDPYFTYGTGKILNCTDMLDLINKNREIKEKTIKSSKATIKKEKKESESKDKKEQEVQNIEALTYEKLKGKNAEWGGTETKTFIAWKKRISDKYTTDTGKGAYYRGNPTKNYINYLEKLSKPTLKKKPVVKKSASKKKKTPKKPTPKKKTVPKKGATKKKSTSKKTTAKKKSSSKK
ncbi:MAG: hypothetical protein EU532_04060 [Promethearchaeota archaeon]|nr:MAG: hypothetical protein EU532_04060 [Candidatus Lokiarchaeota archaeon]